MPASVDWENLLVVYMYVIVPIYHDPLQENIEKGLSAVIHLNEWEECIFLFFSIAIAISNRFENIM